MQLEGKYLYILLENKVLRVDTTLGLTSSASVSSVNGELIVFSDGEVAVCTTTTAYYVTFDQ
jgi:hypothetical protein